MWDPHKYLLQGIIIFQSDLKSKSDKTATHILHIFPVDREYMSVLQTSDTGGLNTWIISLNKNSIAFVITCQNVKYNFRTVNKEDAQVVFEVTVFN